MALQVLIVLIIAAAVWIFSYLTAAQQENKRRLTPPRPPRPGEQEDEPRRPRRASAELEKFLEEVKRRKERDLEQVPEAILVPDEPPRAAPPPPLPRPVEQRRKSVPIGSKPPPRRSEPAIVIQPVTVAPAPSSRTVTMPSLVPAGVQAVQAVQAPPPPPQATQALNRPEALPTQASRTEGVKLVRELLKNRRALAGAFLLREILDKPLCKRRR